MSAALLHTHALQLSEADVEAVKQEIVQEMLEKLQEVRCTAQLPTTRRIQCQTAGG